MGRDYTDPSMTHYYDPEAGAVRAEADDAVSPENQTTKPCATPCGSCPWRAQNQTPSAVEHSPRDVFGTAWFDVRNLRRKWNHVRAGGMMPCHATDPRAHLYGGKRAPIAAESRICVGLTMLARREVRAYLAAGGNFGQYRALGGRRFTLAGLAQWAARLVYSGSTFEIMSLDDGPRGFVMPTVDDARSDVTLPWADPVHAP